MTAREMISRALLEGARLRQEISEDPATLNAIEAASNRISDAFASGNKLLICGNGGSAADSQHMASEFVSRLTKEFDRPALPAIALTTDTSFLTAYSNDCGYEGVFSRQVEALGRKGDVLFGISTSGSSKNVLNAVTAARKIEMITMALVGERGPLTDLVDIAIHIPSRNVQRIQELHLTIEHAICETVERRLFGTS